MSFDRAGARGSSEVRRQEERVLEKKAQRYSELHPDGDHPVEARPPRLLQRVLAVLRRHPPE